MRSETWVFLDGVTSFVWDSSIIFWIQQYLLYFQVVDLLNQAALLQKDAQRISNLKMVQELIVYKEPALLDSFLDVSLILF